MVRPGLVLALIVMGLAGCGSDSIGTGYAGMVQKLGAPPAGQARIVVLLVATAGTALSDNLGPVDIVAVDEAVARTTLA